MNGDIIKTFHYDLYGRIIRETEIETTLFKYDLAGNLIEKETVGQPDKSSQKSKVISLVPVTRYKYDLNGNRTKSSVAIGCRRKQPACHMAEISFAYDSINRLIRVSDKSGAQAEYRYNCLNRKT